MCSCTQCVLLTLQLLCDTGRGSSCGCAAPVCSTSTTHKLCIGSAFTPLVHAVAGHRCPCIHSSRAVMLLYHTVQSKHSAAVAFCTLPPQTPRGCGAHCS